MSISSSGSPTFSVGGLSTGLDTKSIVDQLVAIQGAPLKKLAARQKAYNTQVSTLGDLVSKLQALKDAASALSTSGVVSGSATSTNTQVAVTSAGGTTGRFSISVDSLAAAAKAQSAAFSTQTSPVRGGTLTLGVQGSTYNITITDGQSLADVASAINSSGAAVKANVLYNGTQAFLSLSNLNTGFTPGGVAANALTITENTTGTLGQALGLAVTQTAANAVIRVDGLAFERQSNQVTDVIPGVSMNLVAAKPGTFEDLVMGVDTTKTQANLQKFVDAYNALYKTLGAQMAVTPDSNREAMLVGNSSARSLQGRLQAAIVSKVPAAGMFKSLAEVGIKTNRDGSLTVDTKAMGIALQKDPAAMDHVFSDPASGMSKVVADLWKMYGATGGLLGKSQDSLKRSIADLGKQSDAMQARLDAYRESLNAQYTAMEKIVGGLKAIDSFLSMQSSQNDKG